MTTTDGSATQPAAVIDLRVLPWRPRRRYKGPDVDFALFSGTELLGGVVALVVAVLGAVALLLVVVALALVVLELWIVALVALALLLARFVGLLPWVVDTGRGGYERYRWLPHATRRVRELNGGGPARVRWRWV
ncbi:hypothetical protein [Cellulomonas sp. KH9]|uniref:hypothetical protein n=1 Tax=Cellulomonas sp. KH9 TaxID=1855324 RepID=UPI0008EAA20A|nr:hypothetical protein [Cellulomonas sp. KH9]SFK12624.1 hypothetical protein SAMN05216467_2066 [Cellulomonas sp. KH9]